MKNLFKKIFEHDALKNRPPVFVDIGASGDLYGPWKDIAPYAVCLAFDPDKREIAHITKGQSPYRELRVRNTIVVPDNRTETDFYLTHSPFCSSTLPPETEKLKDWAFASLFNVEKKTKFKAENLKTALAESGLNRIDWFKADTQGTDLSIWKSVPPELAKNVLVVDLEPGLIDAYRGEDKAWQVLEYMEKQDFWLVSMKVQPVKRLSRKLADSLSGEDKPAVERASADAAGWTEMSYLRMPRPDFGIREYLLLCVFALLKHQYGFALEVARAGAHSSGDALFSEIETAVLAEARRRYRKDRLKAKLFKLGGRFVKKLL